MTDRGAVPVPMFPLGTVLVPGAVLPLQIFEERYRAMIREVMAADGEFGVALIERGSEVGGGDVRSSVGCIARVVRAEEMPNGRWALIAAGDRRIRIDDWLEDDPYPHALVTDWPDEDLSQPGLQDPYQGCISTLRAAMGLAAELGRAVPDVDMSLPENPSAGSFALTALAPLGPLDRQRLLIAPGAGPRLDLLGEILAEHIDTLRAELRLRP